MIRGRFAWMALVASTFAVVFALGASASADLESDLSAAESRAAGVEAEVMVAQQRLDAARADFAAASRRAAPVTAAARRARAEASYLRDRLLGRQRDARAEIAELRAAQETEEEEHDDEAATGIGFALAVLLLVAIALGWSQFRGSPVVAALVRMQLGQAVALCLGGGFLLFVIGAGLSEADGLAAMLGWWLAFLGIFLPVALLLGRHSVEIELGQAKRLLGRERPSERVSRGIAILLLLLGVAVFLGAVLGDAPKAPAVSAQLREEAEPPENGPEAARLEKAKAKVTKAVKRAAEPLAQQGAARVALRTASRSVRRTDSLLAEAEADVNRLARRLTVLVEREEREAQREAEREEREAEEVAAEEEEFFEEEEAASGCDPNYSPCVPVYPPDVDCAEVGGSVSSYGSDPHGLDADGDGVGCE